VTPSFIPAPRPGRLNIIQANGTGVPGLRLNRRKGHLVVDVQWNRADGRRAGTSYLADDAPVEAVARAMLRRMQETGAVYEITPLQAWRRLSKALPA
jgi:hypothetical protein